MTDDTDTYTRKILAVYASIAGTGCRNGLGDRLRSAFDQEIYGKSHRRARRAILHRRQRIQIRNQRLHVIVRDVPVFLVRHHREQRAAVLVNAFADCSNLLPVRPGSDTEFRVGRDVRNMHLDRTVLAQERSSTST